MAAVSSTRTTTPNVTDKEGVENFDDESDNIQPPLAFGSNHSFDKIKELVPKTAQLFANRRAHGGRSSRSYYGPLDILDIQADFDSEGIRWNEMFHFGVNNAGNANVVEYKGMQKKVKEMGQEIMFEIFCDRYQNAYVEALLSGKDIEAITVEQINKSIGFNKCNTEIIRQTSWSRLRQTRYSRRRWIVFHFFLTMQLIGHFAYQVCSTIL